MLGNSLGRVAVWPCLPFVDLRPKGFDLSILRLDFGFSGGLRRSCVECSAGGLSSHSVGSLVATHSGVGSLYRMVSSAVE